MSFSDISNNPSDDIRFFSGIAHQAMGDLEGSEELLLPLIDNESLEIPVKWYLSLCYLKGERIEEAKVLLEYIANSGTSRTKEAQNLLDKLN